VSTSLEILHGRWPALRSRDFRLLWSGQVISMVGSQMQNVAIHWHIYGLTHSTLALGAIGLARIGPILLFSLLGGTLADAVERRRVLLATQSMMMAVAATLGLLTGLGRLPVGLIYALIAVQATAAAFDGPSRQSMVPNLVPREHLPNALSLFSIGMQTAKICGPPLAGLLIARSNLAITYWLNAVSYLAVLGALLRMSTSGTEAPPRTPLELEPGWEALPMLRRVPILYRSGLAAIKEAFQFLRRTRILWTAMVLDFFATFFSSADTLLAVFAADILRVGAQGYGWLAGAPAVGSLLAGATLSVTPVLRRQGSVMLAAVVAYGLATLGFGLSRWFPLSLMLLAGTGAADTVSTVIRQTIRQLETPDRLRGRLTGFTMLFFMGGPQLGELEAGAVAKWLGAPASVALGGIGCLIAVALVAWRSPGLRRYEAPAPLLE
jgi:MFS family permease